MKQGLLFPNYTSAVHGFMNLLIIYNDDLRERMNARAELTGLNLFLNYHGFLTLINFTSFPLNSTNAILVTVYACPITNPLLI